MRLKFKCKMVKCEDNMKLGNVECVKSVLRIQEPHKGKRTT